MPTGDSRTNFVDKRHLPQQRVKDTFFDYLAAEVWETARRIWGSRRGVFGTANLVADGADNFKVTVLPLECLDGDGHILILSAALAEGIQFQNALGIPYYAAVRHCLLPDDVERNPRTGILFYDKLVDSVGVTGIPDSVTEVAGTLEVVVDSVLEAGVSHAGRLVTIWLNAPKDVDESVAIERDLVVTWDGVNNLVTTVGLLGQGTVSTTPADYAVAATGVTVRRNTDLSTVDPFAYLGTVTGAGAGNPPAVFSTLGQIDVTSGINGTLDLAYDGGPAGPGAGSGRLINVDSGAVELQARLANSDEIKGALRVDMKDAAEQAQMAAQLIFNTQGHEAGAVNLGVLWHTVGLLASDNPAQVTAGDVVTRTGAVNWVTSNVQPLADLAWLQGFATADGLYSIIAVAATTLQLRTLLGVIPGLGIGEVGSVTILRPTAVAGSTIYGATIMSTLGMKGPNVFQGLNEGGGPPATNAAIKVLGWEDDCLWAYDTVLDPLNPAVRTKINRYGTPTVHGIRVEAQPFAGVLTSELFIQELIAPAEDPPNSQHTARLGRFVNWRDQEILRHSLRGRVADVPRSRDEFNYHGSTWGTAVGVLTPHNLFGSGASPSAEINMSQGPGGWVRVKTDTAVPAIGQLAFLEAARTLRIASAGPVSEAALCFYAKLRSSSVAPDPEIKIGLFDGAGLGIWWAADDSVPTVWTLHVDDGLGGTATEATIFPLVADTDTEVFIVADPFANAGLGYIGGWIKHGGNQDLLAGFVFPSFDGALLSLLGPAVGVVTNDASEAEVFVDFWEAWQDTGLRDGPAE